MTEVEDKPYTTLPLVGSHDIGVGHALITMVEPHEGHEHDYNRWYEDDHIFSGALYLPWLFSGRRWVATYDLQQLRYPKEGSLIVDPITKGCYLTTYWITPGRLDVHKEWSFSVYQRLVAEKRVNNNRDHVFTAFQDKAGTVYRDKSVPKDVFTLFDPSPGLVIEVVDAPSPKTRAALEQWLLNDHLPSRISPGSPISIAMVFRSRGPDTTMAPEVLARVGKIAGVANDPSRLTILWFLTEDPRMIWDKIFLEEGDLVKRSQMGVVSLIAPFIPTKTGTNAYEDQLRVPKPS
jgi:hypothetical protein